VTPSFVFFFQAEDGIRDFHVTGVQTCALPISSEVGLLLEPLICGPSSSEGGPQMSGSRSYPTSDASEKPESGEVVLSLKTVQKKIGRASCRERGCMSGGAERLMRKSRRS